MKIYIHNIVNNYFSPLFQNSRLFSKYLFIRVASLIKQVYSSCSSARTYIIIHKAYGYGLNMEPDKEQYTLKLVPDKGELFSEYSE